MYMYRMYGMCVFNKMTEDKGYEFKMISEAIITNLSFRSVNVM